MSRASKLTLLGTSVFAATTVVFVHIQQQAEKTSMHEGVVRDLEQQRVKRERQLDFDMQRALELELKKEQRVRDTTTGDVDRGVGGAVGGGERSAGRQIVPDLV